MGCGGVGWVGGMKRGGGVVELCGRVNYTKWNNTKHDVDSQPPSSENIVAKMDRYTS